MFNRPILCLVFVSMLGISGCFIEGRVVDENGIGVAGVTVTLNGDQVRMTTTKGDGVYCFGDLKNFDMIPAGNYSITPSKPGYSFTPASTNVTITDQAVGDLENIPGPDLEVDFVATRFNNLVETSYGTVKGFEDEAATWVWKAIPFARPPVGELRWKAPRDPEPWEGVREETSFCSACSQPNFINGKIIGSEDCLYLNIWRPQSAEKDLPVYVWIHGGGNSLGEAAMPGYSGANLASKSKMVFVSMNYRLGPFGWFTHPALRSGEPGDEADDSGNYGTLDLIQALTWIRDNIEAFGGDPNNVTITGESAGGTNVLSLMISPLAKNLFHKAVSQSGIKVGTPVSYGDSSANDVLLKLLVNDGIAADSGSAATYLEGLSDEEIAAYLRSKSYAEMYACYEKMSYGMISAPFIFTDGTVIEAEGFDTFRQGTHPNKVPIVLGSTKEELKMFIFMDISLAGKDDLYQTIAAYGADLWKVNGVDDLARELSSHSDQPPVYTYQFLWGSGWETGDSPIPAPFDLTIGAAHSLDVPFFLGNEDFNVFMTDWVFTEENRAGREALSNAIMAYIAQFVRTGAPGKPGPDLPEWKPWTNATEEPKCILFNADGDLADITMSDIELTNSGVMASMEANVPEPLYSEALEYMQTMELTSFLFDGIL